MGDRHRQSVGGVVRPGKHGQAQEDLYHFLNLSFLRGSIAYDSLLHFIRRVFGKIDSGFRKRKHDDASRLAHAKGRGYIALEEELLNRACVWAMAGDQGFQFAIERQEAHGGPARGGRGDHAIGTWFEFTIGPQADESVAC
jgi:hypothetical protein